MVKIILTGFPALENTVAAINKGVDAYLIKPVNSNELLRTIKEQLEKQNQEVEFSQEKVAQFVETRFKELQAQERDVEKVSKSK
jgi:response regulator RpfG family c-di-GMP phosphodiesterase